ncbi:MAG: hypothetical protein ACLFPS_01950 [Clostridia bacterium]
MYNKIVRNRVFIAAICLILAGFISFKVVPARITSEEMFEKAIVASKNIRAGEKLVLEENLEVKYFNPDNIPTNSLEIDQLQKDLYAKNYISEKEFILTTKVSDEFFDSINTNSDNVIVSLNFDGLAQGVSNKIKKNDLISVVSFSKRENKISYEESLSSLLVLDIVDKNGNSIDNPKNSLINSNDINRSEAVIVSCSLDQAIELIELDKTSEIHFVLTNRHE